MTTGHDPKVDYDPEPLQPHPTMPGLLQCIPCGGVTLERGILGHHLPTCRWRLDREAG